MVFRFRSLASQSSLTARQAIPFFLMVTLAIAGYSAVLLFTRSAAWNPGQAAVFVILVILHIALHWLSPWMAVANYRVTFLYLAVQGALAFTLVMVAREHDLSYVLFLSVIGVTVGLLRSRIPLVAAGVGIALALSGLSLYLMAGPAALREWAVSLAPLTLFVVIYVLLFVRQNEARARAQQLAEELEAANRQLSEYAAQIETLTLTAERQRMARELHDTLAQGLAGLILQLEAASSHLSNGREEKAQSIIQQAMQQARDTLHESRRVIDDLRAAGYPAGDWANAVRQEVERFTSTTGIACQLDLDVSSPPPPESGEHILRIISEGLTNIARHARATQARLSLENRNGEFILQLEDNGCGFELPSSGFIPGHYGLLGMRERARMAGGDLRVTSQPDSGTRLEVRLPRPEEE